MSSSSLIIIIIIISIIVVTVVGRRAIIRHYKVLLNIKIIYSITLYFPFRFCYSLVFVVFN